jgi:hypothetical protein
MVYVHVRTSMYKNFVSRIQRLRIVQQYSTLVRGTHLDPKRVLFVCLYSHAGYQHNTGPQFSIMMKHKPINSCSKSYLKYSQ